MAGTRPTPRPRQAAENAPKANPGEDQGLYTNQISNIEILQLKMT